MRLDEGGPGDGADAEEEGRGRGIAEVRDGDRPVAVVEEDGVSFQKGSATEAEGRGRAGDRRERGLVGCCCDPLGVCARVRWLEEKHHALFRSCSTCSMRACRTGLEVCVGTHRAKSSGSSDAVRRSTFMSPSICRRERRRRRASERRDGLSRDRWTMGGPSQRVEAREREKERVLCFSLWQAIRSFECSLPSCALSSTARKGGRGAAHVPGL